MKLSLAQRIVGYDIEVEKGRSRRPDGTFSNREVFRASGIHPAYQYSMSTYGRTESDALESYVEQNYKEIGSIVRMEQNYCCLGCGRGAIPLQIDHIIMRSAGRSDSRENLRALGIEVSLGGCGCHADRHKYADWKPEYISSEELWPASTR